MNFSGSVIVAMYAGEILLDAGFKVSVIAPYVEKEVADRFILKGIEVIEYSILRYTKYDELIDICDFDFLLANTFTMKSVVESVSGKNQCFGGYTRLQIFINHIFKNLELVKLKIMIKL